MGIVFIGQAPSRTGDAKDPLGGRLAIKLAGLLGVDESVYFEKTVRMNVFDHWPGARGKGDDFPLREAKDRVAKVVMRIPDGWPVVLLGKSVAAAFSVKADYFKWAGFVVVAPHPSGINHFWNSRSNRERARKFFRRLADEL